MKLFGKSLEFGIIFMNWKLIEDEGSFKINEECVAVHVALENEKELLFRFGKKQPFDVGRLDEYSHQGIFEVYRGIT